MKNIEVELECLRWMKDKITKDGKISLFLFLILGNFYLGKSKLRKFAMQKFGDKSDWAFSKGWSDKFVSRNQDKIDEWLAARQFDTAKNLPRK